MSPSFQKVTTVPVDQGVEPKPEPDANQWIKEFAYFLWLAEGQPGQAERHWNIAKAAYRTHCIVTGHQRGDVSGLKVLLSQIAVGSAPTPSDVAYSALAAWADLNKATERFAELFDLLCRTIDEHTVSDGFQLLKSWSSLDGRQKAVKVEEAVRRAWSAVDSGAPQDAITVGVGHEVHWSSARTASGATTSVAPGDASTDQVQERRPTVTHDVIVIATIRDQTGEVVGSVEAQPTPRKEPYLNITARASVSSGQRICKAISAHRITLDLDGKLRFASGPSKDLELSQYVQDQSGGELSLVYDQHEVERAHRTKATLRSKAKKKYVEIDPESIARELESQD